MIPENRTRVRKIGISSKHGTSVLGFLPMNAKCLDSCLTHPQETYMKLVRHSTLTDLIETLPTKNTMADLWIKLTQRRDARN
jgi:hypothetical protein